MSFIKPMLTVAAVVAASLSWSAGARAETTYPFCAATGSSTRCDFQTYEQCQATASGTGADCMANPAGAQAYAEKPVAAPRSSRRHRH